MGVLLAFMFLFNMLGAMLLMPALARWLFHGHIEGKIYSIKVPSAKK
jgi:hypothetical protein